jgi:predicted small lipoprotein YifL
MKSAVLVVTALFAVAACGDDGGGNSPPSAPASIELMTDEDTPVTRGIEATDLDGDELTVTLTGPSHGTATVSGLQLTYTPEPNYHGPDTIGATISDGTASVDVTINVTVVSVNDAPVANPDSFACPEDTTLVISQASLVMNDTDVDGDTLTVTQVASSSNGVAMISGSDVTFTPSPNFSGTATFDYTASDGTASATATVTITVNGVNDPPSTV